MKLTVYIIVNNNKEIIMDPYSPNNNLAVFELLNYAEEYRKIHGGDIYEGEISIKKKY